MYYLSQTIPHAQGSRSLKRLRNLAGQFSWYIADKIKQMQDGVWENQGYVSIYQKSL